MSWEAYFTYPIAGTALWTPLIQIFDSIDYPASLPSSELTSYGQGRQLMHEDGSLSSLFLLSIYKYHSNPMPVIQHQTSYWPNKNKQLCTVLQVERKDESMKITIVSSRSSSRTSCDGLSLGVE